MGVEGLKRGHTALEAPQTAAAAAAAAAPTAI